MNNPGYERCVAQVGRGGGGGRGAAARRAGPHHKTLPALLPSAQQAALEASAHLGLTPPPRPLAPHAAQVRRSLVTATAATAAMSSFLMGAIANVPFAIMPGMGVNA
jgi:hypothetical protein